MLRIDYGKGGDQLGASFLFSSIIITSILSDEMRDENSISRELVFKYDRNAQSLLNSVLIIKPPLHLQCTKEVLLRQI